MALKIRLRERESIQEAVRRFRKLVERSGLKREVRRREYYEKPSETKRRAHLRAERRPGGRVCGACPGWQRGRGSCSSGSFRVG